MEIIFSKSYYLLLLNEFLLKINRTILLFTTLIRLAYTTHLEIKIKFFKKKKHSQITNHNIILRSNPRHPIFFFSDRRRTTNRSTTMLNPIRHPLSEITCTNLPYRSERYHNFLMENHVEFRASFETRREAKEQDSIAGKSLTIYTV